MTSGDPFQGCQVSSCRRWLTICSFSGKKEARTAAGLGIHVTVLTHWFPPPKFWALNGPSWPASWPGTIRGEKSHEGTWGCQVQPRHSRAASCPPSWCPERSLTH